MIEYRSITAADVGRVSLLARRAAESAGDLPVHIDMGKIRAAVTFFAEHGAEHFQLAAFKGGEPVGAIAAYVCEMPFFERCEAQIFMCYSAERGAGMRLVRALVEWFKADMRLRRIVWAMNANAERTSRLARLCGFSHSLETCVLYK